jgi:tetratricopeptide (TPR) repeat protein
MRYQRAEAAEGCLRAAADLGVDEAARVAGLALASIPGREAEAEARYNDRIKAGDASAYHDLGNLLKNQPGREADAEKAFRDSIEFEPISRSAAYWSLGNLLRQQEGREQDAENAYRDAKGRGFFLAHLALAGLLASQPGREQEAEQAVIESIQAIDAQRAQLEPEEGGKGVALPAEPFLDQVYGEALRYRGIVRARQPGRESEAEVAFRDAIAAGDEGASSHLAVLLAGQPGRETEAEQAFRDAAEAGEPQAFANLGIFLSDQAGRDAEAEQALRKAIDGGYKDAYFNLGELLANQGRAQEAEKVLIEAIGSGFGKAWLGSAYEWLGYVIEQQPGREPEAESAYRSAIDGGAGDASMRLGSLLARRPGRERDAEEVYREAIRRGDRRAFGPIGKMLMERAFEGNPSLDDEIEQALRTGSEAGEPALSTTLGMLIALQPGRRAEGCDILQKAAAAGFHGAADIYRSLCEEPVGSAGAQSG